MERPPLDAAMRCQRSKLGSELRGSEPSQWVHPRPRGLRDCDASDDCGAPCIPTVTSGWSVAVFDASEMVSDTRRSRVGTASLKAAGARCGSASSAARSILSASSRFPSSARSSPRLKEMPAWCGCAAPQDGNQARIQHGGAAAWREWSGRVRPGLALAPPGPTLQASQPVQKAAKSIRAHPSGAQESLLPTDCSSQD
jgi:hypothetical protein